MSGRRVVITGIGVIAPGGSDRESFWELITSGRTATRTITSFDASGFRSRVAAEVDFDPARRGVGPREARRMDRAAQFATVCAREALADSGMTAADLPAERTGVVVGSAVGCTMSLDQEYAVVSDSGSSWLVDPEQAVSALYDYLVPSSMAREVAWAVGAEGPGGVVSTGCTSGIDAVGHGAALVREGRADIVVAGATDAPISPITVACFDALKATTPYNDEPATASRPFDLTRKGFVLGEGAAVFVLEDEARAVARDARIYAILGGYATRSNAYHMTGLRPDGRELAEAIRRALDAARVDPAHIDYVNAHGSGTSQNDRHETAAIKVALGEHAYQVPVSSIKSMIGHSLGAIGSIEIAACALALERGAVPPTANLHRPDPECDLDYTPLVARDVALRTVLTVGSGFGGFQSAMVLRRPEVAA